MAHEELDGRAKQKIAEYLGLDIDDTNLLKIYRSTVGGLPYDDVPGKRTRIINFPVATLRGGKDPRYKRCG